jgi:hypothetical protein
MAQEFTINSTAIESKINQLLPSQGGFGAGVDFSASTMVIPIVDLTETAEGSDVRPDLQTALSHGSVTAFSVSNTTTTIVNTTGYFRVFGTATASFFGGTIAFNITDGTTVKRLINFATVPATATPNSLTSYDFIVFLQAGDSLTAQSSSVNFALIGCTRQIADVSGNLVNP